MLRKNPHTGRKVALGASLAAVVGYVTGLLTAPQSGKKTRKDLVEKADELKDDAEDQLKKANDELKDLIKDAKDKTAHLSAQAKEEFNEALIRAKDAQNKAGSALKAFRAGEASDPDLNKAVKQAKQAAKNLSKFFKG